MIKCHFFSHLDGFIPEIKWNCPCPWIADGWKFEKVFKYLLWLCPDVFVGRNTFAGKCEVFFQWWSEQVRVDQVSCLQDVQVGAGNPWGSFLADLSPYGGWSCLGNGDEDALQFEINCFVDEVVIGPLGCIFILHHFWESFQQLSMKFAFWLNSRILYLVVALLWFYVCNILTPFPDWFSCRFWSVFCDLLGLALACNFLILEVLPNH